MISGIGKSLLSYLIQCLRDIGDEILGGFQTAAHAHQLGGHTGGSQLLVVHLTVGAGGGVQAAGAGIGTWVSMAASFSSFIKVLAA